ncbi:MAG: carbon-nitrogen hydrolase family protein [Bacteriovoracaceae bacterium]
MKIGAIQICSVLDYKENLKKIKHYLKEAKELGVEYIFLPEVFYSMSDGQKMSPYLVEEGNEHYKNIQELAKKYELYLLGGSAATVSSNKEKAYNRVYNFDPKGKDLGSYDKMNLFSCDIKKDGSEKRIDEGDTYLKGNTPKVIDVGDFKLGLSVCFDLRFPELYQNYVRMGAQVMTISSAFTKPTGAAHWHTLVKARAIECQCFVVACGQWGEHNEKMSTYGHSLIVGPWGEVLADAGEGEKLVTADIDLDQIQTVRHSVKVFC